MSKEDYKFQMEELKERFGKKESAMFLGKKIIEKIGNEKDFFSMSMDEVFEKANDVINDIHKDLNNKIS
jgi:hypothetical protein